jgi:hypothetical protein
MPDRSALTLIVSDVRVDPEALTAASDSRWPRLARLAGRGTVRRLRVQDCESRALRPWQQALLKACGLDPNSARHASAPLSRLGAETLQAASPAGFWLHAEPVHLAAGLDRLDLVRLTGAAAVTAAERSELGEMLGKHLGLNGFAVHESPESSWLIESASTLDVETACTDSATENLERALPRGADAASLKRLMTELQMLLHEHPVNLARMRRGVLTLNSLWLWGGGRTEAVSRRSVAPAFGDSTYLRGLCRLYGTEAAPLPAGGAALLERCSPRTSAVCVIRTESIDALEARWITPLQHALLAGRIERLDLLLGDWEVSAARLAMLRFWRRPSPPAKWVA